MKSSGTWKLVDGRSILQIQNGAPPRPMIEVRENGYKSLIATFHGVGTDPFGGTAQDNAEWVMEAIRQRLAREQEA